MKRKSQILLLLVFPLVLYILLIACMPLMEPDESRYSDIPRLMNQTGDYVTPRLHHVIYLEKPPLVYWATALIFKVFGENNFSARLFVALCAWGCIILAYCMGAHFRSSKTGLYAAAILSTFLFHFLIGKINILDMPLTFFICFAIWAGYRYISGFGRYKIWLYLLYISSALAFLTKGLIGVVFPFAILGIWLILEKRWRDILDLISPVGMLIFSAIALPWIILAQMANPDFLWFFFVQEHLLRYTTTVHGKDATFFYYFPVVLLGTTPWCAFLWKSFKEGGIKLRRLFTATEYRFIFTWIIFIFLFFSVSSSKLVPYIGPVFIPLSVIFAQIFMVSERKEVPGHSGNWLYHFPIVLQSLLFILILLAPPIIRYLELGKSPIVISENWKYLIIIPVLAQVLLVFLPDLLRRSYRIKPSITIYSLSAIFFCSLIIPLDDFFGPYKSAEPVSQAIKRLVPAGKEVYQYKIALYGVDFYNNIRTPIVEDFGELGDGIRKLPEAERKHYFMSAAEFYARCKQKPEIYCITKYQKRLQDLKKEIPNLEILWDNGAFFLVRLKS